MIKLGYFSRKLPPEIFDVHSFPLLPRYLATPSHLALVAYPETGVRKSGYECCRHIDILLHLSEPIEGSSKSSFKTSFTTRTLRLSRHSLNVSECSSHFACLLLYLFQSPSLLFTQCLL